MRNSLHSFVMREAAVCSQMKPRPIAVLLKLVCSRTRRARTGGGRNNEFWKREVFHVRRSDTLTHCGLDCSDWLDIEPRERNATLADHNCCARCARQLVPADTGGPSK